MAEKIIQPWERLEHQEEMGWADVGVQGLQNLPSSTMKVGGEIYDAVTHPIQTGLTILKLLQGTLHYVLPDEIQQKLDPEGKTEESQQMALQVGQYFKEKYGGEDNIKHAIANDPASVLMDIATVFTGAGAMLNITGKTSKIAAIADAPYVAGKLSALETGGSNLMKAATYVDPLTLTAKGVSGAVSGTGKLVGEYAGAMSGTGAGVSHVVDQARLGGKEGSWFSKGDRGEQLTTAMRGKGDVTDMLHIALKDLEVMKKQKQANYRENKKLWQTDQTALTFEGIEEALARAKNLVEYKGTIKNPVGAEILVKLEKEIAEWKKLDKTTHHTPEGMDALKQKLWSVVEGVPAENATAVALAKNIYHATKKTIADQAPGYAKAMKEYTEASELILELEKTLSLGSKAQIDTAVRKLQSLMRDNVNTNYGQRMKLARQLEEQGGGNFMAGLAGNQMQSWMPRSIQGAVLPTVASGAALSGGATLPSAAAMMAAGSPRIVGETANAIGYTMGKLDKLPKPSYQGIEGILEILYQVQEQQENKRNI